tara:strand:- start:166 stop:687 length:522 start_codon:yes stop_codon:yes gene_type:complete
MPNDEVLKGKFQSTESESGDIKQSCFQIFEKYVMAQYKNKQMVDYDYKEIRSYMDRYKQEERTKIMNRLKHLSDDQRRIEKQFKEHKLGEWNIQMNKGVTHYDADEYDKEVKKMKEQFLNMDEIEEMVMITQHNQDVYLNMTSSMYDNYDKDGDVEFDVTMGEDGDVDMPETL